MLLMMLSTNEMLSAAEIMVGAMVTAIIYNNKVLCYDIQQ